MAVSCEHCGRVRPVMVPMEPGRGTHWQLCSRCYLEGLRPSDYDASKAVPLPPLPVADAAPSPPKKQPQRRARA